MTTLTLVVHVLDHCKQGVCFPEQESVWPLEELGKVLNLSGLVGTLSRVRLTHEQLIQTLLDHLNVQTPAVYALYTNDRQLIMDSSTVQVRRNLVYVGPYAKLQPFPPTHQCHDIWQRFAQYAQPAQKQHAIVATGEEERRLLHQQQGRILELERELAQLKVQCKDSELGRLKSAMQESTHVIKALEAQLREAQSQQAGLREKNFEMTRQTQVSEARAMWLHEQLNLVRTRLSITAQDPVAWESALQDLVALKQQLRACQQT